MPTALTRLVRAALATAVVDCLWAWALALAYGSSFARAWQGVASTLLGRAAFEGGTRTVVIGLAMHVGVAFGWSSVFLVAYLRSAGLRRRLATRAGILQVAAVYGPCIWMVMSLIVVPALIHRPPGITARWFIQLAGHIPFVGIPLVAGIATGGPPAAGAST